MRLYLPAFVFFVSGLITQAADPASLALNPVADTFVSAGNPSANYGGAGALEISGASAPKKEFDALLRFDLASTVAEFNSLFGAGQWTIQAVTLQLTATAASNGLFNPSAPGSLSVKWLGNTSKADGWLEGTGTPNNPNTGDGLTYSGLAALLDPADRDLGSYSVTGATSGTSLWSLSLEPDFVADLQSGGLSSLLLQPSATTASVSALFNSRTFSTESSRPLLTVTAVPEPSTLALLLTTTLLLPRRRRSARFSGDLL